MTVTESISGLQVPKSGALPRLPTVFRFVLSHGFRSLTSRASDLKFLRHGPAAAPASAPSTTIFTGGHGQRDDFLPKDLFNMTAFSKLRGHKGRSLQVSLAFAPVGSVLVAKVSISERRDWPGEVNRAVT